MLAVLALQLALCMSIPKGQPAQGNFHQNTGSLLLPRGLLWWRIWHTGLAWLMLLLFPGSRFNILLSPHGNEYRPFPSSGSWYTWASVPSGNSQKHWDWGHLPPHGSFVAAHLRYLISSPSLCHFRPTWNNLKIPSPKSDPLAVPSSTSKVLWISPS